MWQHVATTGMFLLAPRLNGILSGLDTAPMFELARLVRLQQFLWNLL